MGSFIRYSISNMAFIYKRKCQSLDQKSECLDEAVVL